MPVRWSRRAWSAFAVVGLALTLPLNRADAASGTWGAGGYRYADGRVCTSGASTQPLAAWTVSGGHRAYLTRSLSSTGQLDTGAPPIPSAGTPNQPADVAAGPEFATDRDIAAFAYLLTHGGSAAVMAATVLAETDPGGEPSCADTAAADALITDARRHAGPYRISVDAGPDKPRVGRAAAVTATVQNPSGAPVPGVRVMFTGSGHAAGSAAVTDAQGVAHGSVTIGAPAGGTATVTATASVPVGLIEATITARRSATNPAGASVPAVYAAPAAHYTGATTVTVDQSAHPVVSTVLGAHLVRTGSPFRPAAQVSGLNGHSAGVTFSLLGPVPLARRTLCTGIAASRWSDKTLRLAGTTSATLTGDTTVRGGALTVDTAGCYAVRTTVATIDATPAVSRTAPIVVVAALATTMTTGDPAPAVFPAGGTAEDQISGTSRITDTYGLSAQLKVVLTGPITPASGDCAAGAPQWRRAGKHAVPAELGVRGARTPPGASVEGAGTYAYRARSPDSVGCYQARPVLVLSAGDGVTLSVPGDTATPVYVVHPSVTAEVQRTWSVSPQPVPVQVSVDGLYGLAAHVRTAMYLAAADPAGCARVSYAGAKPAATGPAAPVPAEPGTVTLQVNSGPTPKVGCYTVVPEVTIDANPRISATGVVGVAGSTLVAGVDPNPPDKVAARQTPTGTGTAFIVTMALVAALVLVVALRVGFVAWRERPAAPGR